VHHVGFIILCSKSSHLAHYPPSVLTNGLPLHIAVTGFGLRSKVLSPFRLTILEGSWFLLRDDCLNITSVIDWEEWNGKVVPVHAVKTCMGGGVWLHSLLMLVLAEGEWST
jgi:hypothetical protein